MIKIIINNYNYINIIMSICVLELNDYNNNYIIYNYNLTY